MKKNWLLCPALLLLCGCHVNGDVLLGRHADASMGDYSGTVNSGCYLYRVNATSNFPASTPACTVPQGNLNGISVDADATIHIWVSKLADGRFPFVSSLAYSDSQNVYTPGHTIYFSCMAPSGTQDPNATQQEIKCTPSQGLPLSSVHSSGSDLEFYFNSLTLQDPTCGASTSYSLSSTWGSCDGGITTGAGATVEGVTFPELYWKNSG